MYTFYKLFCTDGPGTETITKQGENKNSEKNKKS